MWVRICIEGISTRVYLLHFWNRVHKIKLCLKFISFATLRCFILFSPVWKVILIATGHNYWEIVDMFLKCDATFVISTLIWNTLNLGFIQRHQREQNELFLKEVKKNWIRIGLNSVWYSAGSSSQKELCLFNTGHLVRQKRNEEGKN